MFTTLMLTVQEFLPSLLRRAIAIKKRWEEERARKNYYSWF